jgi:hypothetical protein
LATTQAVAGAESQVWLRQRVGGSWTAWRWQSGGLPADKFVTFTMNLGAIGAGLNWTSAGDVPFYTSVPLIVEVRFNVNDVSLHHASATAFIYIGMVQGGPSCTLSFSSQKGNDSDHTTFRMTIPAGTFRFRMWITAPAGVSFVYREPEVSIAIQPVAIANADDMTRMSDGQWVAIPEAPPLHHGQWPPEPPPVDTPGGP